MAIDGAKIIDSDLAHDVYGEFMDLYDSNVSIGKIRKKIEQWRNHVADDVEFEIFITTYALALWEIGHLTGSLLNEVKSSISKGAVSKMFREELNEKEAVKRQKELKKLIQKISISKDTPRQRKKFKEVKNFLLDVDSAIAFKLKDDTYRAAILFKISQYRGKCNYLFTPIAFASKKKPVIGDIARGKIFIHKIPSMYDRETVSKSQPGIEKFWKRDKKLSIPFTIGLPIHAIEHKDLVRFVNRFEVIGQVQIGSSFKRLGSIGYESSFVNFCKRFNDVINDNVRMRGYEMIYLKNIL